MTVMDGVAQRGLAAARELRTVMRGEVVTPRDACYARARRIWNGAVNHRPALIAQCETPGDVHASVRVAHIHGLALSVRGGGHDWAGRSLCEGGLVIDLSMMRQVEVDPRTQTATVGGGTTASDLVAAASQHGLVAVTGTVGAVGMAGLTLGGGYGPLIGRYGLALDNLVGAELVLADGRLVNADATENAELFWALRGGGGNFGIVTAMRVRLHPIRVLLSGLILFPWSEAEGVLRGYAKAVASAPDELTVMVGVLPGPGGAPVIFLAPTWSGAPAEGRAVITGLQQLGTPLRVQVGAVTYGDVLGMFDAHVVNGRHYAIQTRWVPELTPQVISALIAGGRDRSSSFSGIVLHHFHGAATRVPLEATAFGVRREHFLVEIIAAWEPEDGVTGAIHRQWAQTLSQDLVPAALPGGYPNLLGPEERDQIALAYGRNIDRLQGVKRRFDPNGMLTSAIALPT